MRDWLIGQSRVWLEVEEQPPVSPPLDFVTYAAEHHRTHKAQRLTFTDRPWLEAIYRDDSPRQVIKKAAQLGVTEYLSARAPYLCEQGMSGLYVMPTERGMFTFVSNRFNRMILASPYYRRLIRAAEGSDSTVLKHIGKGGLKFVGSNAESSFIEYPADFVIADEYDRCHRENLLLLSDRLKATFESRTPHVYEVSTPTFPDYGIDALYTESDQTEWRVTCLACHGEQGFDWFTQVVTQEGGVWRLRDAEWSAADGRDIFMFCEYCHAPWGEEARRAMVLSGRMGSAVPESRIRGYWLPRLLDVFTPVRVLWEGSIDRTGFRDAQSDASALQVFYNSDLGLAYKPEGSGITTAHLDACRLSEYGMTNTLSSYTGPVTAGVDVGRHALHVRISSYPEKKRRACFIGRVSDFSELPALFARYGVTAAVIDLNPETRKVRELQYTLRFLYACEFAPGEKGRALELAIDRDLRLIKVDRTQIIDRMVGEYQTGHVELPHDAATLDRGDFYKHMQTPIRLEKEAKGQRYAVWLERNSGRDDYFFAEVYDCLARMIYAPVVLPFRA